MKIVLTGATGFIGSFLLTKLLDLDHEVAVILRPNANTWRIDHILERCTIIEQNLETLQRAQTEITDFSPEALIHAAWYGVTNDKRNDPQQISINMSIVENLFSVAYNAGVKTIIGLGSQAEYGPANQRINEQQPTRPTTLYGVAKLAACHLLDVLCQQHNIRFVWHRLFSAYGPKDNSSWFIPFLTNQLLQGLSPQLTKGTQLWDFIFVEDAVRAIISTLMHPQASGVFNLGSGNSVRIRSVAEAIAKQINDELILEFGKIDFRPDQVMHLEADISRLKETTDWEPKIALDEGISQTIEWYKTHDYA